MPSKREQLLEIMEDAAKGETKATLRARIAELEAENERLRNMLNSYGKLDAELTIAERRIEALSRTGAVKVDNIDRRAKEAADAIGVTPHSDMRLFVEQAAKYALSVLESASEAQLAAPSPTVGEDEYQRIAKALDAYRFYIDASEEELKERGIDRDRALAIAREIDPYDGTNPTALPRLIERAVTEALEYHLAQLRHAYSHLKEGTVVDQGTFADGLISPAIAAIETALSALQPVEPSDMTVAHAVGKNADAPFGWTTDAFGKPMPKRSPWDGGDVPLSRSTKRTVAHAVGEDGQESQQQPVAWGVFYRGKIVAVSLHKGYHYTVPLYTHPSEQAVTEAMVDAVVEAIRPYTRDTLFLDEHQMLVREALKTAMEAGR